MSLERVLAEQAACRAYDGNDKIGALWGELDWRVEQILGNYILDYLSRQRLIDFSNHGLYFFTRQRPVSSAVSVPLAPLFTG